MTKFRKPLSSSDVSSFRRKYGIPSTVEIRKPHRNNTMSFDDGSWMKLPAVAITEGGIRFPLPRLLRQLLDVLGLHPCQLSPHSYRIIGGILKLNEMEGIGIGVWEILYCYNVRPTNMASADQFTLHARPNLSIIQCLSTSEKHDNKVKILVRGNWEFPHDEIDPIACRRTQGHLAKIPHWSKLESKINLGRLKSKVLNRSHGPLGGVYWRSSPVLGGYDPSSKRFTSLPIGVSPSQARDFFSSQEFRSLLRNQDSPSQPVKGEEVSCSESIGAVGEEIQYENKRMKEENVDSMGNPENDGSQAWSGEFDDMFDDIPSLKIEDHETHVASDFDYMDDIPSLGVEDHDISSTHDIPSTFMSDPDLVPPIQDDIPECSNKRKHFGHLSAEDLSKKGKSLHDVYGKEKIDSMSLDDVVTYSQNFVEKIGEVCLSATKEVTRLNTVVENLERRASTAENKLLASESFAQGYQSENHELREKLKLLELLECQRKEEKKEARAEAIEQCGVKYAKEVAVTVNHHYGRGWGGALMAAKVEGSSCLWNSDSIPWPHKGAEFPRPNIKRMLKSDAFSNKPSGRT